MKTTLALSGKAGSAYAAKMLAERLGKYLDDVRRVSEYEIKMDAIGVRYAKDSYAWE